MQREVDEKELEREISKSLLNWYPFSRGEKVLYVGGESDAYIEVLYQSGADVTCVDMEELIGSLSVDGESISESVIAQQSSVYDSIVCIAYLELIQNPDILLSVFSKMIKPTGRLLLGMNNRLGIRYFCGDRDPYTERNFDGIEDYQRAYMKKEDVFRGRCYSKEELQAFLKNTGWMQSKFFSVFSDLKHPYLLVAEDYAINKNDLLAWIPVYNNPDTLFLEEENLYQTLIKEEMMHKMANAFLIECSLDSKDVISDVCWVRTCADSLKENAIATILRKSGRIEQYAVYPEAQQRISQMVGHAKMLQERGICMMNGTLEEDVWKMPVVEYKTGVAYLKELLFADKEKFLCELDHFRDLIFQSSEIIKEDRGDGKGVILEHGFLNLTPENCYYMNGEFVFWNQEFCAKNYPANALLLRMLLCLYKGDMEAGKALPMDALLERYGLKEKINLWWRADWWFLYRNKNRHVMWTHYKKVQKDYNMLNSNRQRINYNTDDYQKLFVDIFKNADTRKLILFGSGQFTKKFLTLYKDSYPVYAIIDNNSAKWGEEIEGVVIHSPELLKEFKSGEYKVIICIKNYLSVMKQLDELGVGDYSIYDWNKDYPRPLRAIVAASNSENEAPKKYNVGYVAGVFDMFHVGHVNLLRRAKEMCNYLIVGVLQDESVYRQKQKYPMISCEDRAEVLKSCRYADQVEVLPLDYAGIRDAHRLFHFDCQFSGDDHGEEWQGDKEFLNSKGADIVFFKYTEKVSSTMLREQLKEEA